MNTPSRRVAEFAALCTAVLLLSAGAATAATLSLPIGTHSVLSGVNGTTGILINFEALDTLVGKRILYAKCFLNIRHDSCAGAVEGMDAMPLVEHASALATGTFRLPNSSEVAFTDAYSTDADARPGSDGDTEILLTELLQAWVDGRMPKNGLVLVPRASGCVYELLTKNEYPSGGYGKLLVKFTDTGRRTGD